MAKFNDHIRLSDFKDMIHFLASADGDNKTLSRDQQGSDSPFFYVAEERERNFQDVSAAEVLLNK